MPRSIWLGSDCVRNDLMACGHRNLFGPVTSKITIITLFLT